MDKGKHRLLALAAFLFLCCTTISAQKFALKTNALYDATASINLGAEMALSPKWTVEVSGNYNPFTFSDNRKWKHWFVQPEVRYWTCNKMMGHFFGAHLIGGQFNVGNIDFDADILGSDFSKLKDSRFEGWAVGAGLAYGYAWVLSRHFNIEGEIGVGYAYMRYDRFACINCGEKLEDDLSHNYFGLTKLALNLVYIF